MGSGLICQVKPGNLLPSRAVQRSDYNPASPRAFPEYPLRTLFLDSYPYIWYTPFMETPTTLVIVSGTSAGALAIHRLLPLPGHFPAGLRLLTWAQAEGLETCPLCSSAVGSAHIATCHEHYQGIAEASEPPFHLTSAGLLEDTAAIRLAHPQAIPADIPSTWAILRAEVPRPAVTPPTQMGLYLLRELGYTDAQILGMPLSECTRLIEEGIPAERPANVLPFP